MDDLTQKIVARCLARNPTERFPDVASLLTALEGRDPNCGTPPAELWARDGGPWEAACEALVVGDFEGALRLCREILSVDPSHRKAAAMVGELEERRKQAERFYEGLNQEMDKSALGELAELAEEASGIYPGHPLATLVQAKLAGKARRFRTCLETGAEALRNGQWNSALTHLRNAIEIDPTRIGLLHSVERLSELIHEIMALRRDLDKVDMDDDLAAAVAAARALDRRVETIVSALDLEDDHDE